MAKLSKTEKATLLAIVNANAANSAIYVSAAEGKTLAEQGLIAVDPSKQDPSNPQKIAALATDAGKAMVAAGNSTPSMQTFEITSGVVLPPSKRGGGGAGAPTIYPFDKLEVGQGFFVPASEKHPTPAKSLQSSVSAANERYATPTGETKQVKRAERDPNDKKKALKGPDGKNIIKEVTVPVKKYERKFVIRAFEQNGVAGAYIQRVALD